MSHVLYRIGHFAGRHPWRVIAAWILVAGAVFMLNSSIGGELRRELQPPGLRVAARRRRHRGSLPAGDAVHLERDLPLRGRPHRPGDARPPIEQAVAELADGRHVIAVNNPYDPADPPSVRTAQTAFATVGVRHREDRRRGARRRREGRPGASVTPGIQVEYDGGLGYAEVPTPAATAR